MMGMTNVTIVNQKKSNLDRHQLDIKEGNIRTQGEKQYVSNLSQGAMAAK